MSALVSFHQQSRAYIDITICMIADRTDRRLVGSSCIEGRIALWTGKKVSLTDSPCVLAVVAMIVELLYYNDSVLRTGNSSGRMPDKKQSVRMVMPSQLTSTGLMPGCISLGGRVVRLRLLEQKAGDEAREKKKTKGSNRNKRGSNRPPNPGYEVHLACGATSEDTIVVQTWVADYIQMMKQADSRRSGLVIRKGEVREHTTETKLWTTSRCPYYVRIPAGGSMQVVAGEPQWPVMHPITSSQELCSLRHPDLVCVAGCIVEPAPAKKTVKVSTEEVEVANAFLRIDDRVVRLSAWRQLTPQVENLRVGQNYFFDTVKIDKTLDETGELGLVMIVPSKVLTCPSHLELALSGESIAVDAGNSAADVANSSRILPALDESTAADAVKPAGIAQDRVLGDVTNEEAKWSTVSMLALMKSSNQWQAASTVWITPACFIAPARGGLAYRGCSSCKKGLQDGKPSCQCGQSHQCHWKSSVTVTDLTGQVDAVVFEGIVELKPIFDQLRLAGEFIPENYLVDNDKGMANTMEAMALIAAIPFTILVEPRHQRHQNAIELVIRKIRPTWEEEPLSIGPLPRIAGETRMRIPFTPICKSGQIAIALVEVRGYCDEGEVTM